MALVDQAQGGQLLTRIRALRKHLALQLGFIIPPVHITDNVQLNPREYVIRLRGVEIARWEMAQESLLAISSEATAQPLEGRETREPAFNVPAKWIAPNLRDRALAAGYAVVDQTSVLATHLAEVIKQHAHELLTRQETKRLLDAHAESQPKLDGGARSQTAQLGRGAKGAPATVARAGFDSRPGHDSGDAPRHGEREQEPGIAGGNRAAGFGPRPRSALARATMGSSPSSSLIPRWRNNSRRCWTRRRPTARPTPCNLP